MAVAALTGHGDPDVLALLPATVSADRVALVGLHAWTEDDIGNVAEWGIHSFAPEDLRDTSQPVLDWLAATGCSRVAIHFDVDTIDSNEIVLGLGAEPDGLTSTQVRRIVADIDTTTDVVALTVAEFIPRQVMHLQQLLSSLPCWEPQGARRRGQPGVAVSAPASPSVRMRCPAALSPSGGRRRRLDDRQYPSTCGSPPSSISFPQSSP